MTDPSPEVREIVKRSMTCLKCTALSAKHFADSLEDESRRMKALIEEWSAKNPLK